MAATGLPGPAHRDTQGLSLRALRRVRAQRGGRIIFPELPMGTEEGKRSGEKPLEMAETQIPLGQGPCFWAPRLGVTRIREFLVSQEFTGSRTRSQQQHSSCWVSFCKLLHTPQGLRPCAYCPAAPERAALPQ